MSDNMNGCYLSANFSFVDTFSRRDTLQKTLHMIEFLDDILAVPSIPNPFKRAYATYVWCSDGRSSPGCKPSAVMALAVKVAATVAGALVVTVARPAMVAQTPL